jgi:flagellar hook-basal body complex protein FliE
MAIDKVNPAAAANAYANIQKTALTSGITGADQTGGTTFGDLLQKTAADSIDTLKQGDKATATAITGKAELTDVVQAITNADLTLQTVVAARDRILSAYQTIMNMPI